MQCYEVLDNTSLVSLVSSSVRFIRWYEYESIEDDKVRLIAVDLNEIPFGKKEKKRKKLCEGFCPLQ